MCSSYSSRCYGAPVASVTALKPRRSLLGTVLAVVQAWAAARQRGRPSRVAAMAAMARQHVVTVAALASVDVGAFHWGGGVGWIVTGLSLLALDFAVTG